MIIARINGFEISVEEFNVELQHMMSLLKIEEPTMEVKKRALEQLIDGLLLLQSAKKSDISVSEDLIEEKLVDIMLQYDSQEQFYAMLEENNLDLKSIKKKFYNEILTKLFIQKKFSCLDEINYDKLHDIYLENLDSFKTQEMVRASHIFIADDGEDSFRKINEIRDSITNEDDFVRYAASFSDCPSNCKCGDLGYFSRGKMVKEFEDIAFDLNIHEISQPVKTQFGYHLILLTDKKPAKTASFEDVKDALLRRLEQIESELKLIKFLKRKRAEAEIEIFSELL